MGKDCAGGVEGSGGEEGPGSAGRPEKASTPCKLWLHWRLSSADNPCEDGARAESQAGGSRPGTMHLLSWMMRGAAASPEPE